MLQTMFLWLVFFLAINYSLALPNQGLVETLLPKAKVDQGWVENSSEGEGIMFYQDSLLFNRTENLIFIRFCARSN